MDSPLTPEEDRLLRQQTMRLFESYLVELLGGNDESMLCVGTIYLPYVAFLKKNTFVNNGMGGDLKYIPKLLLTKNEFTTSISAIGAQSEATEIQDGFIRQTKETIDFLVVTMDNCEKRFFILSTILIPIGDRQGHQSILLFDNEQRVCISLDPEASVPDIVKLYTQLLKRLNRSDYRLIVQQEQCIQALVKDNNCMFWSLFLISKYIKGSYKTIDEISKDVIANTADLPSLIETFKQQLYRQKRISDKQGGKHQWETFSLGNRKQQRRQRRLRKTNSRNLKRGRHTRRRV